MKKVVIIGVGQERGLGAQLAIRFANMGMHIFIASRTISSLKPLCKKIENNGGRVTAVKADATKENDIKKLFERVGSNLKLAIYNTGNNFPGKIIEMSSDYFEKSWRSCCFGGFLFGKEAILKMIKSGEGTLLFTGASASLRGRANFGAFNSAKSGLRSLAQAMAKEYGPNGIHIGHIVVDGAINGEKIKKNNPDLAEKLGDKGMINIEGIVESYVHLFNQSPSAWTFEIDLRTSTEKW